MSTIRCSTRNSTRNSDGTDSHASPVAAVALLLLLAVAVSAPAQETASPDPESALVRAYQREFVFLNNEIRILQQRLEEVTQEGEARVGEARRELERIEGDLLRLTAEVDRRNEQLRIVEEEQLDTQDADDALRNVVTQGSARLRSNGRPSFSESEQAPADQELSGGDRLTLELDYVFTESFALLRELGSIRTEGDAQFFLPSGQEVSGSIVHIGRIGAFGVSPEASGTLAPAGGGRLRLVDESTADTAQRLARGSTDVDVLPLFLYESLDELAETSSRQSLADTVEGGGIIGYVIIGIGAVALLLILVRVFLLLRAGRYDAKGLEAVFSAAQERDLEKAYSTASAQPGAMGRVLSATVRGLQVDPENIEDVISESVLNEQPSVDRFRSALSVFAAVAPLLGLLGTVTGMIATFEVITQFGTGDPRLLSGGISEALITTEFGLIVAIPVLLIGNLLSSWADRITSNIEVSALRLVNIAAGYDATKVS